MLGDNGQMEERKQGKEEEEKVEKAKKQEEFVAKPVPQQIGPTLGIAVHHTGLPSGGTSPSACLLAQTEADLDLNKGKEELKVKYNDVLMVGLPVNHTMVSKPVNIKFR